jgi:hypothetical protein
MSASLTSQANSGITAFTVASSIAPGYENGRNSLTGKIGCIETKVMAGGDDGNLQHGDAVGPPSMVSGGRWVAAFDRFHRSSADRRATLIDRYILSSGRSVRRE